MKQLLNATKKKKILTENLIVQALFNFAIIKMELIMFHIVALKYGIKVHQEMVQLEILLAGTDMLEFVMEKEMLFIHIMMVI